MLIFELSLWFWIFVVAELIFLTWFVEERWGLASVVSIVSFLFLCWWLAGIPVWKWIYQNPVLLLIYILLYIILGALWTIVKYYFVLIKLREVLEWRKKLDPSFVYPTFNQSKSIKGLAFYAAFWPTSMLWTLINNPIKKFFNWLIYRALINIFKRIYKKMIENNFTPN